MPTGRKTPTQLNSTQCMYVCTYVRVCMCVRTYVSMHVGIRVYVCKRGMFSSEDDNLRSLGGRVCNFYVTAGKQALDPMYSYRL